MQVALSEVLGALSYALDITEGEPPGHAVRTTAIGMRLGEQLGLGEEDRSALFYALLLKDAGCSSNAARLSSLFAADDHATKRAMKVVDWSRPGALARYTWENIAPGGSTLAKARQLRRITREDEVTREVIGTRCERGADGAQAPRPLVRSGARRRPARDPRRPRLLGAVRGCADGARGGRLGAG